MRSWTQPERKSENTKSGSSFFIPEKIGHVSCFDRNIDKQEKPCYNICMTKDLRNAGVFLDLSRDEMFSPEQREVFRAMAMKRGARDLETVPQERPHRQKRRRRERRRA